MPSRWRHPAPGALGRCINVADDEYRRRCEPPAATLHAAETLVQAVTVQGAGFWVLTPLQLG